MYATDLVLFGVMTGYAQRLAQGLTDEELDAQPAPGMNTPRWILAHLAICNDYTAGFFGDSTKLCPESWHAAYGPESRPADPAAPKPGLAELVSKLTEGAERVQRLVPRGLPAGVAEQPNPFEIIRKPLPTVGVLVGHLLTTHMGVHLGQFSAWRRCLGKPSV